MGVETWLPPLTSGMILVSGLFLVAGWIAIKRKQRERHHRLMLGATIFAALFLVLYVTRFLLLGAKPFEHGGWLRTLYFAILIPHSILAMVVGPAALLAIYRANKKQFRQHRRIGRWLVPVWLFVAASGWVIYWMLYQL
ncbi:MAG: DUF420 domain-containing protein [Ardenticatenia bacterium]|nr:DUF420 domain-containing protein [Ardenticatena maritima]RME11066.1 MAG: DUF420 domain-containing protein [Ardenticatenia bacterium]GAP62542.1 putative membrane protein [Ardenticatena maritima]